jgi:hypothetical protein
MKYFAQLHYQCYFVGMNKLQIGKGREFEICGEMTDRTPTDTFNIFKIFIRIEKLCSMYNASNQNMKIRVILRIVKMI